MKFQTLTPSPLRGEGWVGVKVAALIIPRPNERLKNMGVYGGKWWF